MLAHDGPAISWTCLRGVSRARWSPSRSACSKTSARSTRWRARALGSHSVSCRAGSTLARDGNWSVSIANVTHHVFAQNRPPLHDTDCGRGRSWWLATIDRAWHWWSLPTIAPHRYPTAGAPAGHPPFGALFPPLFAVGPSPSGAVRAPATQLERTLWVRWELAAAQARKRRGSRG